MTETHTPAAPDHPHIHGNVLGALTKKYGPLPGWGWVAVGVAAYLAFRWYQDRNTSSTGTGATVTGADTGTSGADGSGGSVHVVYRHRPRTHHGGHGGGGPRQINYVTVAGDTLHKLSTHYYGSPQYWLHIRHHNIAVLGIIGPDHDIGAGKHIVIPLDRGSAA